MDPFVRRVYLSVATVLILIWLGLLGWFVYQYQPAFMSYLVSSPAKVTDTLLDFTPFLNVPGVKFSIYHTVPGDTFNGLAARFHVSEAALRSLNQANFQIEPKADTTIAIPDRDAIFHVVRQGQGLADISRAYGIPLKEVLKANHKKGDQDIKPGEVLILPGAAYLSRSDVRWISLVSLQVQKGFLKPTTGRFADGFGMRRHPITGKMAFHSGLDLAPGWHARVVASQDGQAIFTGIKAGYGRVIVLDHGGGLTSWYAHLDEILLKNGQFVKRGELIGKVGQTGKVTGPHLHFEIRLNGKPQNPLLYLVQ